MFFARVLALSVAVSTTAMATPTAAAQTNLQKTARIPEHLSAPRLAQVTRKLVRAGAPGALAVVRTPTGVRRAASGFASREPRLSLLATDRFRIASITKTFVATVVLQLVAEGKVRLADPVERWLPGLLSNGSEITIRDLLDHTSGLFNYVDDPDFKRALIADPTRSWSPRELVAFANAHAPLFPPGTDWSYSNTNYVVLGLVVEAVTGTALERELRERIFEPLGLAATSFPSGTEIEGEYAHGYIGPVTLPMPPRALIDMTPLLSPTWLWAAGGIVSTGDDVTSFFAALLGGRLLPADLLAAMRRISPQSRSGVFQYGLGIERFSTRCGQAYGYLGDFVGYRTVVYASPDGSRVAVVMVNVDTTHVSWSELESAAEQAFCSR
jgi:D-alanyl-D-alanine carboxypeptidase